MKDFKDIKGLKEKLSDSKKFRYGSSSVVFTAVFVVFVLLINVVISVIDDKTGGLYADMTSKQIYTVSEQSKKALENVTQPIEIIFASPKDIVEGADSLNSVKMLCESYEKLYDNISVSYHDVLSEVAYFNKFKTTSNDEITSASLVVYCPSTGLSKIFSLLEGGGYLSDMYKYSETGGGQYRQFAFDGENKLTNAFLNVTGNSGMSLKAGFTTGHNEEINDIFKVFLEDYGYKVDNIELKKITSKQLAQYDIVIICEPRSDFSGRNSGGVNEIELLRDYVIEDYGNIMYFASCTGAELPELHALMDESFGVTLNNNALIMEGDSNVVSGTQGMAFFGSYSDTSSGLGYKIHKPVSEGQSRSYPLFYNCLQMDIHNNEAGGISVYPLIVTSRDAVSFDGESPKKWQNKPVMAISRYTKLIDGVEKTANVLACGSSSFLYYLDIPAYSNSDLLRRTLSEINKGASATSIDFKVLDETAITVTKQQSESMTKRLAIIVPVIIAAAGIVVFIKRKYL